QGQQTGDARQPSEYPARFVLAGAHQQAPAVSALDMQGTLDDDCCGHEGYSLSGPASARGQRGQRCRVESDHDLAAGAVIVDLGDESAKDSDLVSRRQGLPLRLEKSQCLRRCWAALVFFAFIVWMRGSQSQCLLQPMAVLAHARDLLDNEALDLGCRQRLGRARVPAPLLGFGAHVIAIAWTAVLAGVGRCHGASTRPTAQQPLEQSPEPV